jgi:integrase
MVKLRGKIYWCDYRTPDGKRIRQSLRTADEKEAKTLEAKLIAQIEGKSDRKYLPGITLKDAYTNALRRRDEWRSAKSPESITKVNGYVVKHFGENRTLESLDEETLVSYGEDLIKAGLSASTVNKRLSHINVLFEEATAAKKYHGTIPRVSRYKPNSGRRRVITPDEEERVLSLLWSKGTALTHAMADLVIVLADTGCRLSEALRITPNRVYREERAVLLKDTKNGEDRVVPLTERAYEVLVRRNTSPMFAPLNVNNVEHIWAQVRKQMGLEGDLEFVMHAFRHTYASTLANAGVDSFRLQKVMGHKSIQSTQRYIKISLSALMGLPKIIEERIGKHKRSIPPPPNKPDSTEE